MRTAHDDSQNEWVASFITGYNHADVSPHISPSATLSTWIYQSQWDSAKKVDIILKSMQNNEKAYPFMNKLYKLW